MTSMTRSRLPVLAVVLALAGCATTISRPAVLPLPARPVLTPVKSSSVQCLAAADYVTLVNRERALRTWGLQLEAVIRANNAKASQ
jgi:hypothetical protein